MYKKPSRIYLEVTKQCINNCIHCYSDFTDTSTDELNLKEIKNIITQTVKLGTKNIIITGGEPLIRNDIPDVLYYCRKNNLNTKLLTSGTLIDKELILKFNKLKINIQLSLDGVSEKTHDYIRGQGAFQHFINFIEVLKLINYKNFSVHLTVNRLNIKELSYFPVLLKTLEIKNYSISSIKPAGRALNHPEILIYPDLQPVIADKYEMILRNKHLNHIYYPEKNWVNFGCPASYTKFGITANGNVIPCAFLEKNYTGKNIRNYSLKELWENDETINKLRNRIPVGICKNCDQLKLQSGGCPARSLYYNYDINAPDPFCCETKNIKTHYALCKKFINLR